MKLVFSTLLLTLLSPWVTADEAVYSRGQELAQQCLGCHGETGIAPVTTNPNLAGQSAAYLTKQLKNFKASPDGKPALRQNAGAMPAVIPTADLTARRRNEAARPDAEELSFCPSCKAPLMPWPLVQPPASRAP